MKRRVAVVTASRADYGLLYWLLRGLKEDSAFTLQLLACGGHLSPAFGRTADRIRADGFTLAARVDTLPSGGSGADLARAIGGGTAGFGAAFARLRPHLLVVLGDRYELLSAACAAVAARLPIAHIHGGESTEGVLDEQVRHALTKMSHLHFAAAPLYRERIIQMGEDPRRVYQFGAPGLEYLRRLKPLPREALEARLKLALESPVVLATYHPDGGPVAPMLKALDRVGARSVLTYAGADPGGARINRELRAYAARRPGRSAAVPSLGQRDYLSLLAQVDAVVGNSSSGIIEAPSLRVPTVNIGPRQAGRLRSPSVIDCANDAASIGRALRRALSPAFRRRFCRGRNAYGDGRVAERIIGVLKKVELGPDLLRKSFHDKN